MDNLFAEAYRCLLESDVQLKLNITRELADLVAGCDTVPQPLALPEPRPGRPNKPELVAPRNLPRRKLTDREGRAAMIHSFAHIEFNAINLALDLICRFQSMPLAFYQDWAHVASEEAHHFELLQGRLQQLGFAYGDFPAHDGLWQMAEETAHDILLRLAVVPRILEARGLDVTPDLINCFHEIKDNETVAVLNVIYRDEIGHVKTGSQWFQYICRQRKQDPEQTFRNIFQEFAPRGGNKLNQHARLQAGFSQAELDAMLTTI